ncbi:MAG TPA: cytidylate kinase-like family protein [Bacteroidales bacterium]|nr:cytidylate kinase-like family protein [Bacteroidales bacterium]
MKTDLSKYLEEWYKDISTKNIYPGPVLTISRELGCPAKKLACLLTEELNKRKRKHGKEHDWHWISKEILSESAKELNVDCNQIEHIFEYKKRSVLEDLLMAQSKEYYKSDFKIRTTISKVIRGFANNGNAIIVGRGGVAITHDIPKSLHIMLEAPLEWRAARTAAKHDMPIEKARSYAIKIDKKRAQFRDYFHGKGTDYTRFDIKFNCMTLDIQEITNIIIAALETRKFI